MRQAIADSKANFDGYTLCRLLAVPLLLSIALVACVNERDDQGMSVEHSIVQTDTGPVQGMVLEKYRIFQGIPYAAPPTGELRWRSPQPVTPWSAPRDATKPGTICPQVAEVFADVSSVEEDCLFVNLTTPLSASPQRLKPVMVWIHGGGGTNGAGSFFGAQRLAVDGDVVVVTFNYRLGIFGAFGYPGLEGSGTFGLQDQQAVLRWVQRNAVAFGGDPHNVTLFGESYGGYSTSAQLTSPTAAGLLHRAVMQSSLAMLDYPSGTLMPGVPALPSMWLAPAEMEALGSAVAAQLGCTDPATALACLRRLPVESLLPHSSLFTRYAYGNSVLPEDPVQALRNGRFHRVPVISGATQDEARLFVGLFYDLAGQAVTPQRYAELLAEAFGDAAGQVAAHYPLSTYDTPSQAWATVITDRVWALRTMEQHQRFAAHVPTYAFEFADRQAPSNVPFPPSFLPGAYHNAEVVYQFTLVGAEADLTHDQWLLARQMNQYWANFARTGDPNGGDLPQWRPFKPTETVPNVQSLAPGAGSIQPVDYAAEHQLDFWSSLRS
jgi:para-nitrobenzyl esterase